MERQHTGAYEIISMTGERVKAFIPMPLPPKSPVVLPPNCIDGTTGLWQP